MDVVFFCDKSVEFQTNGSYVVMVLLISFRLSS